MLSKPKKKEMRIIHVLSLSSIIMYYYLLIYIIYYYIYYYSCADSSPKAFCFLHCECELLIFFTSVVSWFHCSRVAAASSEGPPININHMVSQSLELRCHCHLLSLLDLLIWVLNQKIGVVTPQIMNFNRVFHYKL